MSDYFAMSGRLFVELPSFQDEGLVFVDAFQIVAIIPAMNAFSEPSIQGSSIYLHRNEEEVRSSLQPKEVMERLQNAFKALQHDRRPSALSSIPDFTHKPPYGGTCESMPAPQEASDR